MDIYQKKSRWKLILFLAGLTIVLISLVYTNQIAQQVAEEERAKAKLWADAITAASVIDENCLTFVSNIIIDIKTIPVIITDETGRIGDFANLDPSRENDETYIQKQLEIMKDANSSIDIEVLGVRQKLYYKNTHLLTMLQYFPFFQLGLISLFLGVGYWAFSSARRSEQNQVWVGMSKETAHQLGTPISSMVAWYEHLKIEAEGNEYQQGILKEFRKDIGRLELIAERFSKIGSKPTLEPINIYHTLEETFKYMKRRAPKSVKFDYPDTSQAPMLAKINPPLFDWVLENLLKNALDASNGKGTISAEVFDDEDYLYIDISDTGKGIAPGKLRTVFQPGYTTKKRGWGLGLSLTKRIVENYHSGRIFVKESQLNQGTTFRIQLPKN